MAVRQAEHAQTFTGEHVIDRIQANVRAAIVTLRQVVERVAQYDRSIGLTIARIVLSDANRTLTNAEADCAWIRVSGTLSAARTITWPYQSTDADTHFRWVTNATGGGFAITLKTPHGTLSVATATTRAVAFTKDGPVQLV